MPRSTKTPASSSKTKASASSSKKRAPAAKARASSKVTRSSKTGRFVRQRGGSDTNDVIADALQPPGLETSNLVGSASNTARAAANAGAGPALIAGEYAGDHAGGGNLQLGQSLKDLAVPFGLVLAKTGFQAWRKTRSRDTPSDGKKKSSGSSTKARSSTASRSKKGSTGTRRRSTVGGGSTNSGAAGSNFSQVFRDISDYVDRMRR